MTPPLQFIPLPIRGLTLKNRVVVAPLHQYAAVKGFANDWHIMNAGRYAAGGAGLVMVESTKIARGRVAAALERAAAEAQGVDDWDDWELVAPSAIASERALAAGASAHR